MALIDKINDIITPAVKRNGCDIVRTAIHSSGKTTRLQIMIERLDGQYVTINDCEMVSKDVSAILDVEDIIQHKYILEVSSPGLDRPLVKPLDYQKFVGKHVVIKTFAEKDGKRTFCGILSAATDDNIQIKDKNSLVDFGYKEIKFAHIDGAKEM